MLLTFRGHRLSLPVLTISLFSVLLFLLWSGNAIPSSVLGSIPPVVGIPEILNDIQNRTLGFEKIFVINLPTRTDHHDAMALTAQMSNVDLEWVDGVKGEEVLDKVLPPGGSRKNLRPSEIGYWRAHMNAIAKIVEYNLTTALIMEDNADWDVRIRDQLQNFSLATQALIQPLSYDLNTFADPTYPTPSNKTNDHPQRDIYFDHLPPTMPPTYSPYGDNWDVLWLGHCGVRFPNTSLEAWAADSRKHAKGRTVLLDDETVPETKHLDLLSQDDDIRKLYPPHTRIVHHPMGSICSVAYAVTQTGAQRILYQMGIKAFTNPFDIMLREYCDGTKGMDYHNCITVQPQLFSRHHAAGRTSSFTDVPQHGDEVNGKPSTVNIRWSSRMNLEALLKGRMDFEDQFPNGA